MAVGKMYFHKNDVMLKVLSSLKDGRILVFGGARDGYVDGPGTPLFKKLRCSRKISSQKKRILQHKGEYKRLGVSSDLAGKIRSAGGVAQGWDESPALKGPSFPTALVTACCEELSVLKS